MNNVTYAVAQYTLTANKAERVEIYGKSIFVRDASAEILIRLNGPDSPAIPINKGERLRTSGFELFIIESTSTQNVDLIIAPTDELKIEGINVVATVTVNPGSDLQTTADASVLATTKSSVLAANAARKEVCITNLASNIAQIRVGDTNTGAGRGEPLMPGQCTWLETEGEIFVYNEGASTQSVAILEILK